MMKRPVLAFALSGILGIVFAFRRIGIDTLILLLVLMLLLTYFSFKRQKISRDILLALFITFIVFFIRMRSVSGKFDGYDVKLARFQQMNVKVEGVLETEGYSDNSHYYILNDAVVSTAYGSFEELSKQNKKKYSHRYNQKIGKVKIYEKKDNTDYGPIFSSLLKSGNRLSFVCSIMDNEYPTNDGEFDFKTYNRGKNISATFFSTSDINVLNNTSDLLLDAISKIKSKIINQIFLVYDFEDAGILSAMLTGDKTNLLSSIKKLFSNSGVAHILAISGLHLSILGLGLFELLRKRFSLNVSATITTLFIVLYGILIDASPTSVRAIFMLLLRFISLSIGKTYDSMASLALAALLILLYNPYILFNAGFQFSFVAIYALNLYDTSKVEGKFIKVIIPSVLLQLFILPITIFHYFRYPIYSILLNLIIIPLMAVVLCVGIASIAISFINFNVGYFLSGTIHYIFKFYKLLMNFELTLPYARVVLGRPSINQIIIYYIALLIIVNSAALNLNMTVGDIKNVKHKNSKKVLLLSVYVLAVVSSFFVLLVKRKHNLQVNYLNVGQGDSIVIKSNNYLFTIDGGSTSNKSNGEYILQPFILQGASDIIDVAFITHIDSDHTNGIKFLLSKEGDVRIKKMILPISAKGDARYDELKKLAESKNTLVTYFKAGDSMSFSNDKNILCLYPQNDSYIADPNKHSLILFLKSGDKDKFLFMGDAGVDEELIAIENAKKLNVDIRNAILKLGHHGSSTSSSEEFIDYISPEIAILSYGKNNQYGHPHKEVVETIFNKDIKDISTAVRGQITIEK